MSSDKVEQLTDETNFLNRHQEEKVADTKDTHVSLKNNESSSSSSSSTSSNDFESSKDDDPNDKIDQVTDRVLNDRIAHKEQNATLTDTTGNDSPASRSESFSLPGSNRNRSFPMKVRSIYWSLS
jgi:hypothetical protein